MSGNDTSDVWERRAKCELRCGKSWGACIKTPSRKCCLARVRYATAQQAEAVCNLLRLKILERHDASVHKSSDPIRNLDRRRNVGIVKRIVEWIAEEGETVVMMETGDADTKSEAAAPIRPVSVVRVVG